MRPHSAYRNQAALSWTRIDMLLAIYDAGIDAAQRGLQAIERGDQTTLARERIRLQRVLLQILDGLLPEMGDVPRQVQALTLHMLDGASQTSPEAWGSVHRVLSILRNGFHGIRDEAAELEARGEIAPAGEQAALHAIA